MKMKPSYQSIWLVVILFVFSASVFAEPWIHKGFKQGMTFIQFKGHAKRLGFNPSNCENRTTCTISKPSSDGYEFLSFSFCENNNKTVKDVWWTKEGGSLSQFVEAIEEFKSTYNVAYTNIYDTNKFESTFGGTGEKIYGSNFWVEIVRAGVHDWRLYVGLEGYDDWRRISNVNTSISFSGRCP